MADANLYRFSSKEWSAKAGLYCYGRRFYDPILQRWINRDPLSEGGGFNLYGFIHNSEPNLVDLNGLYPPPGPYPDKTYVPFTPPPISSGNQPTTDPNSPNGSEGASGFAGLFDLLNNLLDDGIQDIGILKFRKARCEAASRTPAGTKGYWLFNKDNYSIKPWMDWNGPVLGPDPDPWIPFEVDGTKPWITLPATPKIVSPDVITSYPIPFQGSRINNPTMIMPH